MTSPVGPRDQQMQTGCDTVDVGTWEVFGECFVDRVAAAVSDSGEPQVPVEGTAGDGFRKAQLPQPCRQRPW
ncbi:MAG TPA: hypothetical protein VHH52_12295 [Pseudonocardiaceae bacterium]|nr:hypothetical protein [Pseudonocardiaceae bacterium]